MKLQAISGLRKGCEPLAYVTVPKDLTKIKSKMLFGLTKRQLVCFGSAARVGVPLFFLGKGSMGTAPAALDRMRTLAGELFPAWRERFALVTGRADAGGASHGERT